MEREIKKQPETHIDLSDRLRSLIKSKAEGVEGLDELIEGTIKQIMEKAGVNPDEVNNFRKGFFVR